MRITPIIKQGYFKCNGYASVVTYILYCLAQLRFTDKKYGTVANRDLSR